MKLAKRLLSLTIALLMVFALVACNDDPVDTNTGSQGGPNNTDTNSNNTSSEDVEFDPGPRPYDETKGKTF